MHAKGSLQAIHLRLKLRNLLMRVLQDIESSSQGTHMRLQDHLLLIEPLGDFLKTFVQGVREFLLHQIGIEGVCIGEADPDIAASGGGILPLSKSRMLNQRGFDG